VAEGGGGRREATAKETDSSGIDSDGAESSRDLESGGDLESFGMKSEMTRGGLLFIGSKILTVDLN
jgi:hypothetical protein